MTTDKFQPQENCTPCVSLSVTTVSPVPTKESHMLLFITASFVLHTHCNCQCSHTQKHGNKDSQYQYQTKANPKLQTDVCTHVYACVFARSEQKITQVKSWIGYGKHLIALCRNSQVFCTKIFGSEKFLCFLAFHMLPENILQ